MSVNAARTNVMRVSWLLRAPPPAPASAPGTAPRAPAASTAHLGAYDDAIRVKHNTVTLYLVNHFGATPPMPPNSYTPSSSAPHATAATAPHMRTAACAGNTLNRYELRLPALRHAAGTAWPYVLESKSNAEGATPYDCHDGGASALFV